MHNRFSRRKRTMQGGGAPDADKEDLLSVSELSERERERALLYTYFTSAS